MKKKALKPYIKILIHAIGLYIILPAVFLAFRIVTVASGAWAVILSIIAIILYIQFIFTIFLPGIGAILDLITKNFVTVEIIHENSFVVPIKIRHS